MGDSENGKLEKGALKAILKRKGALGEIAEMVKYRILTLQIQF